MEKLRVFLVDDHAALREGLRLLVNTQMDMEVVGQAGDGRTALKQIRDCPRVDVVVMDVSMPEMNGADATRQLKQSNPDIRILALTRHSDQGYLQKLLQAGARGYALKQAAAEELINAIRIVATGGTYLDPMLKNSVVENFVGRQRAKGKTTAKPLSARETEVLRLIAWGHSNKEIAASLGISVKTVEYHKTRFMEKLDLRSRTDIVRYALLQGWLKET